MKNSFQKINLETRFCKIIMILRGVDERELARRTGFALGSIRNLLSSNGSYADVKPAIERVLDCRIWTTPAQFRENQRRQT